MTSPTPNFSLGVIADVQYADMADSHVEGRTQRFREVPPKLEAAVADLTDRATAGKIGAVLTMGDIINGNREDAALTPSDLETVAAILDKLPPTLPTHHVLGNHCLDLPKADVMARLRVPSPPPTAHYSAPLAPGWRLLVIDTTEMSGHAQDDAGTPAATEAAAWLASHPLGEANPQASPWNGGITQAQLAWLRDQIAQVAAAGDRVVVAAHHQAGPGPSVRRTHAAWNHGAIFDAITAAQPDGRPSPVALYLAGHDHEGGYEHTGGVHWVTLEAMCEAPTGSNAYAVLHFFDDRIEVEGVGSVTSRVLKL